MSLTDPPPTPPLWPWWDNQTTNTKAGILTAVVIAIIAAIIWLCFAAPMVVFKAVILIIIACFVTFIYFIIRDFLL